MGWIKRNLFLVVGGILTLGLLGAAGFYIYTSVSRNSEKIDKLNEIYGTLKGLAPQPGKPGPGNDKVNNTEIAKQQERQLREWLAASTNYFQPITPVPDPTGGPVTSESFANALHRTLDLLQRRAENANVTLPTKYGFSFGAQLSLVKFSPGSLDDLAAQLGEVKTVSEILFAAGVNSLDSVQRVRVSDDDAGGPQSDYLDDHSVTNDLAIITPYVVTFRAFSPEIAQVLSGFASSPHGFIVKGINVQPAGAAGAAMATPDMPPGMQGQPQFGAPPTMSAPVVGKGGLETVLKEQLLRATIEVELVKLTPKS